MARSRRRRDVLRTGEPYYRSTELDSVPRSYSEDLVRSGTFSEQEDFSGVPWTKAFSIVPAGTRRYGLRSAPVSWVSFRESIRVPSRVKFCVDRSIRRSVLFARGVAGRGRRKSPGPYRRSDKSYYRC